MQALGDRMKLYEQATGARLVPRMPFVIRVDGRAFHTLAKKMQRPFDDRLIELVDNVALALMGGVAGAVLAYAQSDEVSVLVHPYRSIHEQPWFGGKVQKIVSISAALASAEATCRWTNMAFNERLVQFDARVFNLPESEVSNYFFWRQKDWNRNSLQMFARSYFSHKELQGKKSEDMHEMLHSKGVNWAKLPDALKNGRSFTDVGQRAVCFDFSPEGDGREFVRELFEGRGGMRGVPPSLLYSRQLSWGKRWGLLYSK